MIIIDVLALAALIAVDQVTKFLALKYLAPVESVTVIEGLLDLAFVRNNGAAFGLFQGARWFFIGLAVLIIGAIVYYYLKNRKNENFTFVRISLLLITSGAIGNFIDRFATGYVVDFFNVRFIQFPVFNVADIYIVVGTIMLIVYIVFFMKGKEPDAKDGVKA
ncbi:MAG: signal peptidase II [Clostridiales bacterium]|jgi:signal peptidase II|nr:signal peptidase II [Clostridiales bacterium]